jgi:hypothetical protein
MSKWKRTNLQNTTQKTKLRTKRTQLNTGGELRWSGRISSSCSTSGNLRILTEPILRRSVYSILTSQSDDPPFVSVAYPTLHFYNRWVPTGRLYMGYAVYVAQHHFYVRWNQNSSPIFFNIFFAIEMKVNTKLATQLRTSTL